MEKANYLAHRKMSEIEIKGLERSENFSYLERNDT